jgi:hypothetical protein
VEQGFAKEDRELTGGSAYRYTSTKTNLKGRGKHVMGAIFNGLTAHGK